MNEFMQRGQLAVKNKNALESIEWFSKAVKESPKDPQALACLGQSLCWDGKLEEGLVQLQKAGYVLLKKSRKSRDVNLVLDLSDQLQHWNDYHGALDLCKQAVKINPGAVRAYQFLSVIYLRFNQKKNALSVARKALKLVPESTILQILLATVEIANGLHDQAKERLSLLVKNPLLKAEEKFRAHKELARTLDKLGEYDQVFFHLHAATEVSIKIPEVVKQDVKIVPDMLQSHKDGFDSDLLGRWKDAAFLNEHKAPVFVLGFMRTGTTLTQEVLNAHSEVLVADETDLVSQGVKELGRMSKGIGSLVDQLRLLDDDGVRYLRDFYWKKAHALYGDKLDGKLLLDKTTMNSIEIGFINCIFPDAKLIFLIRDPRDICLSCMMQTMTPTGSTVHLFSWQGAARFYAQVMGWWVSVRPKLSMANIELRYEDAVFDFESTFQQVFDFLELEWDPRVKDFHKNVAGKFIASPSFDQVAQPLYSSSVGRWKFYESEYTEVLEQLQPYIDIYGYE